MLEPIKQQRKVKSFVLRAGRLTDSQERYIAEGWPKWGLHIQQEQLDFTSIFGRQAPVVFEIGFGMGDSLAEMALAMPEKDFIGVEVHRPGVGRLLGLIEQNNIRNIRIFSEDAIEVLRCAIPEASLSTVQLFFPDPWPKKRHHKRRIVQSAFVAQVQQSLSLGGVFHMSTDWEPYAEHMMEVMSAAQGFENQAGIGNYSTQPLWRPATKFQTRGEKLGHAVFDLLFTKTAAS